MPTERIDDAGDPRVADYRALTDRAEGERRARDGVFAVEGRALVERLLDASRFRARSVLATPSALAVLEGAVARHPHLAIYEASADVLRAIAGYPFHRGCLALAERGEPVALDALIAARGPRTLVALERLADPSNVGAVFRSALALGAGGVVLSDRCADPLYRKAIRASAGAALALPFARAGDWPGALARLASAGYALVALTPRTDATDIGQVAAGDRVALLVGPEDEGLADDTLARADVRVRIPMAPGVDSLNAATAAAIALHRLARLP